MWLFGRDRATECQPRPLDEGSDAPLSFAAWLLEEVADSVEQELPEESTGAELEDMYDFSRFVAPTRHVGPSHSTCCSKEQPIEVEESVPAAGEHRHQEQEDDQGYSNADLERLRHVEAKLRQRQTALENQMAGKEKKLAAASRALEKTKAQMRQLTEQIEIKDKSGCKANEQADVLHRLLEQKQLRLQAALDEAASALECSGAEARGQPQEPPSHQFMEKAQQEEQLLQLAAMTEELTDALESARVAEEEVRRQLTLTTARLQDERSQRLAFERDLQTTRRDQESEIAALKKRLEDQERSLALERTRVKELEARPKFFDFDIIKKSPVDFPDIQA
jgi:chromosome segregation ATPase